MPEACGWAMLVIEVRNRRVWKLSIKGSRVPWTGVDSGQDVLAPVMALPRYCHLTLGEFLCDSVSQKHPVGLGRGG